MKTIPVFLEGFGMFDVTPEQYEEYLAQQAEYHAEHILFLAKVKASRARDRRIFFGVRILLWAVPVLSLACLLVGCGGGGDEEDTTGNMTIGKPDCSIPKSCV